MANGKEIELITFDLNEETNKAASIEKPLEFDLDTINNTKGSFGDIADSTKTSTSGSGTKVENFKRLKLDRGYQLGLSLDEHRAKNQSNLDKFGNFVGQGLLDGVVGQTIGAVGSIGGIAEVLYDKAVGNELSDFNNFLLDWSKDIKETSKETFPIFRRNPDKSFDVSDFGWWAEGGVNVFSTVGLLIPGFAAGKLTGKAFSQLGKIIGVTSKNQKLLTAFGELGGGALMQRNAEGFMESGQLAVSTKDDLLSEWINPTKWEEASKSKAAKELIDQGIEVNPENLATYIGAKAGWRAYNINNVNIAFDVLQMAPLFKSTKGLTSKFKIPKISTNKKLLKPAVNVFNKYGGSFLRQSTEGIEEGINFIATEEGDFYGKKLLGKKPETSAGVRAGEYVSDGNFWESVFWGVIGGVAFEGAGKALSNITESGEKFKDSIKEGKSITQALRDSVSDPSNPEIQGQLFEIAQRKELIQQGINKIAAIENNLVYKDNITDELVDVGQLSEQEKLDAIEDIKFGLGFELGKTSASFGNFDSLIEQIQNKDFQNKLVEDQFTTEKEVNLATENLIKDATLGRDLFVKHKDSFNDIEDLAIKDKAIGKAISIDLIRNYLQKNNNKSIQRESTDKLNNISYINLIKNNPFYETLLDLKATELVSSNVDLFLNNYPNIIKNKEAAKENILKKVDVLNKQLQEQIDNNNKPDNSELTKDLDSIIGEKAYQLSIRALDPVLAKEIDKINTPEILNSIIEENKIKEKKASETQIKELKDSVDSITNSDLSITDKINDVKSLSALLPQAVKVKGDNIINKKVKELEFLERKELSKDAPNQPELTNELIQTSPLEHIGEGEITIADPNGEIGETIYASSIFDEDIEDSLEESKDINSEENIDIEEETNVDKTVQQINSIQTEVSNYKSSNKEDKIKKETIKINKDKTINEGSTSIVLVAREEELVNFANFNDKDNIIIKSTDLINNILSGKYKVGTNVKLRPILESNDFADSNNPESIAIEILDNDNQLIGFINSLSAKINFFNKEKTRLIEEGYISVKNKFSQEQSEEARLAKKVYLDSIREEGKNLRKLREYIFSNKDSFALAPFTTRITKLTSGSIINIDKTQSLEQSFGTQDRVLYKVSPVNTQSLEAPNREDIPDFFRNADENSIQNNIDSRYTKGSFYTLVTSPNGLQLPVKLKSSNLDNNYATKAYEAIKEIIDLINNKNLTTASKEVKNIKDFLNEITYVGKNNVEIFNDEIKLQYPTEKGIGVTRLFFNNPDKITGAIQLNLQKGTLDNKGKFNKTSQVFNNVNKIDQIMIEDLKELLHNPNKQFINTDSKYYSPLDKTFDNIPNAGAIPFNNYYNYLNKANILVSNIGNIKNENGDIISNFSVKGKSNLILAIDTGIKIKRNKTSIEKVIENENSIVNTPFTNFKDYNKKIGISNSNFSLLYNYADKKGFKVIVSEKVSNGRLAEFDRKTNNILLNKNTLASKETEENFSKLLDEILAHEIIHGFIVKEIINEKALNDELLDFIIGIKQHKQTAPKSVKNLLKYIEGNSPQEVVALAYTNNDFASWLSSIKSNVKGEGRTLLTDIKDIIKKFLKDLVGYSNTDKLDELDNILNKNINDSIIPKVIDNDSDFTDLLGDALGFPNIDTIPESSPEDHLSNRELIVASNLVSSYFLRVQEKLPNKSEEHYKSGLFNTLVNQASKPEYKAKENLIKVLNNFDKVWNLSKFNLKKDQDIFFEEEQNLSKEFSLDKDFDDLGVLRKNVKDNVPSIVKDEIKKTPLVKDINTELEGKERFILDKNNFLQLPTFLNFDLVYPYLQDKLSSIENSNDLLNKLEELSIFHPSLFYIKENIKDNKQVLSAFTSHFIKQKSDYIVDLVTVVNQGIEYNTRVSNRNNPEKILVDTWKTDIINNIESNRYTTKKLSNINDIVSNIQKSLKDFNNNKEDILLSTQELLSEIGIKINSEKTLSSIINGELNSVENLKRFGTPLGIYNSTYFRPLQFIVKNINKNEFDNTKDLLVLSKSINNYIIIPVQNVLLDVNGNPLYGITLPNFLNKTFKEFSKEDKLKDRVLLYNKIPSLKKSNWVQLMGKVSEDGDVIINKDFFDKFNYYIEDGLKSREYLAGTKYGNLSQEEWDVINLLKYVKNIDRSFVDSPILIPADSSNIYYLSVPKFELNYTSDNKISTSSPAFIALKNIAYQEIEAMKQAKDLMFNVDETTGEINLKENLDTDILQLHYHYTLDNKGNRVYLKEGIPTGNVFSFQNIPELNNINLRFNGLIANNYKEQAREFNSVISNFLIEDAKNSIKEFDSYKNAILPLIKDKGYTWDKFINEFSINSFITNVEMSNLFHGNLSEYKNSIDIGKRLKQVLAPGLAQADNYGVSFSAITINDVIEKSDSIPSLASQIAKNLPNRIKYTSIESKFDINNIINETPNSNLEKDVFNVIKPYLKVNSTDAQGYISLNRFKQILGNEGRLDFELENLIDRIEKGERINRDELNKVLEPVKGFFYDRYYDESLNKLTSKQIKYSTIPLISQLVEGTYLEDIKDIMSKNNIDEVIYESSSKVGTKIINKLHNKDGSINKESLINLKPEIYNNSNWQRQLDVPDKIEDQEKLLAVQISRIIFGNNSKSKPLFKRYSELISENIEEDAISILKDLGYNRTEDNQLILTDPDKLQKAFEEEIESRNLPVAFKEGISYQNGSKKFRLPLSVSALSSKYQSIFLSRFTKQITDQKLPGFTSVQFSSAFMHKKSNSSVGILSENIDSNKNPEEPLQFVKTENGYIAEVLVSPYDSRFYINGKTININELSDEAKTLVGYRIPTDALHSMITLKVVGFLPRESSTVMVIPKELTTQMGSDFDVDKLSIAKYNLDENFNKVIGKDKKGRQNEILDIFIEILTDPEHIIDLVKASEFNNFKEASDLNNKLYNKETSSLNIFSYLGQKELRNKNLSGKALTGIAANINTFSYVAQETGMEISKDFGILVSYNKKDLISNYKEIFKDSIISDKGSKVTIRHTKLANNDSNTFQNVKGQLITDIQGESLASAVDTVKDPLHPSINSNTYTFPKMATMTLVGIDVNTASLFINQPIIKKLTKQHFDSNSILSLKKTNAIEETRKIYERALLDILGKKYKVYQTLKSKSNEEASDYIGYNIGEITEISQDVLEKNIKDSINYKELSNENKVSYLINQLQTLENFANISKITNEFNTLISATKVDNLGTGPTVATTTNLIQTIENANKFTEGDSGNIIDTSIIQIAGKNAIKSIYPSFFGLDNESKYLPLDSYMNNANLVSIYAASELFLEATPYIRDFSLETLREFSIPVSIQSLTDINRKLISQILSQNERLRQTDYNSIIKGDNSVGKNLENILNNPKYTKLINDNTNVLHYLSVELTEDFDKVIFKNTNDPVISDFVYNSIKEMYQSDDEILNNLVLDLFKYSFINNGLNFGSSSLSSLFPVELYEDLDIVKTMEHAKSMSQSYDITVFSPNVRDIIARNNWKNRNIVPKVSKRQIRVYDNEIIGISRSNSFISNKIKNSNYIYYPVYRKANKEELQKNPDKKLVLEKDFIYNKVYQTAETNFYIPVPKLGESGKYIDFYDNIENNSKKEIAALDIPYSNVDEAILYLEGIFPSGEAPNSLIQQSKIEGEEIEDIKLIRDKVILLTNSFRNAGINVEIQTDYDIDSNAQVETINGKPVITINPNKVFNDTIIHEFGHIYVDLIGYNSPQIQFGINELRNSALWKSVQSAYPELSGENLEKEILVTAIGKEGSNIFRDKNKESRFKRWLNRIWSKISNMLGLNNQTIAQKLAQEMIDAKLQRNLEGEFSDKIQKSKSLTTPDSVKNLIRKRIIDKNKQIQRFLSNKEFVKKSTRFIEDFENLTNAESIIHIKDYLGSAIKGIEKRIDGIKSEGKPTPEAFSKLYNASIILDSFSDIQTLDISNIDTSSGEGQELEKALKSMKALVNPLSDINSKLTETAKDLYRKKLAAISSNPKVIKGLMDIFETQLDESLSQAWGDAMADTNNTFLALVVKDYNIELDKASNKSRNLIREWDNNISKLKKHNITFEEFFESDTEGKKTGKLLTEFDVFAYEDSKNAMWNKVNKIRANSGTSPKEINLSRSEINKIKLAWFKENQVPVDNVNNIIKDKKEELTERQFSEWKKSNIRTIKGIKIFDGELAQPSSKYKSKRFESLMKETNNERDLTKQEFYKYFKNLLNELVDDFNGGIIRKGYLPAVPVDTRTSMQYIKDKVLKLKESINNKDEDNYVNYDENGNLISMLFMPYVNLINQQDVPSLNFKGLNKEQKNELIKERDRIIKENKRKHAEGINYEFDKIIPAFINKATEFNAKSEIEHQVLLSAEIFSRGKIIKQNKFLDKIASSVEQKNVSQIVDAKNSNNEFHINNWIEMQLYGNFKLPENELLVKASDALLNYSSLTGIGFNVFSGLNNKVFGVIQNNIESSGGAFFTGKDYREAMKFYNSSDAILSYISGRNNRESSTLAEALIKRFNIYASHNELDGLPDGKERTSLNILKFGQDAAYAMQTITEHSIQNVGLFAMMNSHRIVKDKLMNFSQFIEGKTKKIEEGAREEEISEIFERNKEIHKQAKEEFEQYTKLIDAYELKDGYAAQKEGFNISDETLSIFKQKAISVNQMLHGIYNREDANVIQRYYLGRLGMQFRKWMRPGWNKRFGSKFGKTFWNERREAPDEGMYITTYNFIKELVKDYKTLTNSYKYNWTNLNEYQKSNVRRTVVEMGYLLGSIMLLSIAQGLADDDDDLKNNRLFNMLIYQLDRTRLEIVTYLPIYGWFNEGLKLQRSPIAGTRILEDSYKLTRDIFMYPIRTKEEREYRSGIKYGKSKISVGVKNLLPFVNQRERLLNVNENNQFYKLL